MKKIIIAIVFLYFQTLLIAQKPQNMLIQGVDYSYYNLPNNYLALIKNRNIKFDMMDLVVFDNKNVLYKNETKELTDPSGKVSLLIPTSILKRVDQKVIKYPIHVYLKYLDPKDNIYEMPGRDMLANNHGQLRSLYSFGAVNISVNDNEGARLVVSKKLSVIKKQTTFLKINNFKTIPQDIISWSLNISNALWEPMDSDNVSFGNEESGDNNILVSDIPLVPFNLDIPKRAIPLKIYVHSKQKGKYTIKISGDNNETFYAIKRSIIIKDRPVPIKVLCPESSKLKLTINIVNMEKTSILEKNYTTKLATANYKYDSTASFWKITKSDGSKITWEVYDSFIF